MEDEREDAAPAPQDEQPKERRKPGAVGENTLSDSRKQQFIAAVIDAKLREVSTGEKVNYRQCARDAGYPEASCKTMSYYLRNKPDVQAEVRMRLAASGISDAEIVGMPASIIKYSLADVIDIFPDGTWEVNLNKAVNNGSIHAIQELGHDAKGRPKIKMYDKLRASDLLASIRGLKRADVQMKDLELRKMVIEDDIRVFRDKVLIQTGGDVAAADHAADEYRADLRTRPEYAPYMDDASDRTRDTDPIQ
jgi:hypothetical protein